MNTLIIGMGEIGRALNEILKEHYLVITKDKDRIVKFPEITVMHICIPYSFDFVKIVVGYAKEFKPMYIVNHSSVSVGTTKTIGGKVDCPVFHSPIRGHHQDMVNEIKTYVKYISFDNTDAYEVQKIGKYFREAGIETKIFPDTELTELMKLLELARYGVYIAFAKEQEKICEYFGKMYHSVVNELEETSNEGLIALGKSEQCQPILYPFKDYVGGHCVIEDMKILLKQIDKQIKIPLLCKAHKIDKGTVIWPNCNIYPKAKIGKGCSIGQFTEIDNDVIIGNKVRIGAYCFIPSGVTIEDDCFIAPKVSFANDKHPPSKKEQWVKTLVKKGAVIGVGSVILPGITIGENAVVGAGSVVTKDIPDKEIWYGQAAYKHNIKEKVYENCDSPT